MRYLLLLVMFHFSFSSLVAQEEDAFFIKKIYDLSMTDGSSYQWLTYLSEEIGGRLAGSENYDKAALYTKSMLEELEMDSVWLQGCEVKNWERGSNEQVTIVRSQNKSNLALRATSLGNSEGSGKNGVQAEVVEVFSLDELDDQGDKLTGKIVFFNRPMDPTQLRTFNAYGGAVDQRVWGASRAAKYGAVGTLVRSMTTRLDSFPHTGTLVYEEGVKKIPSMAISTMDAEILSAELKEGAVEIYMENHCGMKGTRQNFNVIGEIKGSKYPDEIILVGGHLDSWDIGGGAHDDGAGCVHAMQVIEILKKAGYKPNRTIRCVLFANEENGLSGGKKYAEVANAEGKYHLAAIESDAGGFTPRGFSFDAEKEVIEERLKKVSTWTDLLEPYGLYFEKGGSGADISPLKSQKGLLAGFRPDSQRYFDYHHTEIDQIEAVNERELKLGAASITSLVYLIDKYGL